MKTIKLFVMAVLAISLTACGGGGGLNPTSKKVNGPLGKFFEVVERDYNMNENELSVEFKRIAEGGPTDASRYSAFTVELQDENGNSIASDHTDHIFDEEQLEAVFSLGVGETASITFKFDNDKAKEAVKFKVSSKWEGGDSSDTKADDDSNSDDNDSDSDVDTSSSSSSEESSSSSEESSSSSEESSSSSEESSSGSEDWDALLDSYEDYVDQYISLLKKAANGDVTAMAEYPSLLQKAQDFGNKLENAKGSMSTSQLARYSKISMKMVKAAQEMQ